MRTFCLVSTGDLILDTFFKVSDPHLSTILNLNPRSSRNVVFMLKPTMVKVGGEASLKAKTLKLLESYKFCISYLSGKAVTRIYIGILKSGSQIFLCRSGSGFDADSNPDSERHQNDYFNGGCERYFLTVGKGWTTYETLRPLAYSTLADLVHHVRQNLPLADLAR
jgi:hypothetical protein